MMAVQITGPLTALDITRSPLEIFIDKLNTLNSRQLSASEFTLSEPEPVAGDDPTLTSISLMPVVSSVFYNSVVLEYHRLSLADVFFFDSQLKSNDYSTLYQILPYVNSAYGVNLTTDDVYDDDIAYTQPGNLDSLGLVTVRAKPTSALFFGEVVVRVNVISSEGANVNEDDRTYFALRVDNSTSSYPSLAQVHLECNDILGDIPAEFSFFEGAQKLYTNASGGMIIFWKTANNTFRMMGADFTVLDPATPAAKTTYRQLEIDGRGALVPSGCSPTGPIFQSLTDFVVDEIVGRIYVLSGTYASSIDNLHAFDMQGNYIQSLKSVIPQIVGHDTLVEAIALDKFSHLFVVQKTITTLQERNIYRITPSLVLDPGFTPIKLNTRNLTAFISCVDELLYLALPSSSISPSITVNGTPIWQDPPPGALSKLLLRFDTATGAPDADFNALMPEYGAAFGGTFNAATVPAGSSHLLSLGNYLIVPCTTTANPLGMSLPWFNVYSADGTQRITTGQLQGTDYFQISHFVLPVSSYEFLIAVSTSPTNPGFAFLMSRSGVYSTTFFKGTKPGSIQYLATVSPDDNV